MLPYFPLYRAVLSERRPVWRMGAIDISTLLVALHHIVVHSITPIPVSPELYAAALPEGPSTGTTRRTGTRNRTVQRGTLRDLWEGRAQMSESAIGDTSREGELRGFCLLRGGTKTGWVMMC